MRHSGYLAHQRPWRLILLAKAAAFAGFEPAAVGAAAPPLAPLTARIGWTSGQALAEPGIANRVSVMEWAWNIVFKRCRDRVWTRCHGMRCGNDTARSRCSIIGRSPG